MRIVFKRNTHDEKGEYREDEYFGYISIPKKLKEFSDIGKTPTEEQYDEWRKYNESLKEQELFFGVHTFSGNEEMDLEQIYQETFKLLNGGALCGKYDPKDPKLTIEGHLKSLAFMIEHKLITAEIRVA